MKRLTYISEYARYLTRAEVQKIGEISQENNARENITGALLVFDGKFFQILEGDESILDRTYERILRDNRHTNVRCLDVEKNIVSRRFPDWGMKTIQLDESTDVLLDPIKSILGSMTNSQRILEIYTQPSIVQMMQKGIDPTDLSHVREDRIVMFSDIASFTTMSESLPATEIERVLDAYFEAASTAVYSHKGEINKLTGDGFLAHFGADNADGAMDAALEILTSLERLRTGADDTSPLKFLYCGIGLARGSVTIGNFGSRKKMEYTLHGDAVNTASRLESFTRKVDHLLVFTDDVKARLSGRWKTRAIGKYRAKGKATPVSVFTLNHTAVQKASGKENLASEVKAGLEKRIASTVLSGATA